ncbi:hypothetical protein PG997_007591 [Apiospora hydei]|uniref:Peptidyl-tRNA hydrolase n=1 Tax=Apiospora hydei TaxID=1337664 RepID=A0ABR1WCB4_9PEZI
MNESGDAVAKAYRQFVSASASATVDEWPTLVVLHDEMELAPGQLRLGPGAASAKGHNGLKSVQQSLRSTGLGGPAGGEEGAVLAGRVRDREARGVDAEEGGCLGFRAGAAS